METLWVPSFGLCSASPFHVQEGLRYGTTCESRNHPEREMRNHHSNFCWADAPIAYPFRIVHLGRRAAQRPVRRQHVQRYHAHPTYKRFTIL